MIFRLPKVPKKTVYCCYFYHLLFVFFSSSFCSIINFLSRKMCTTTLKYQNRLPFQQFHIKCCRLRISMNKEKNLIQTVGVLYFTWSVWAWKFREQWLRFVMIKHWSSSFISDLPPWSYCTFILNGQDTPVLSSLKVPWEKCLKLNWTLCHRGTCLWIVLAAGVSLKYRLQAINCPFCLITANLSL